MSAAAGLRFRVAVSRTLSAARASPSASASFSSSLLLHPAFRPTCHTRSLVAAVNSFQQSSPKPSPLLRQQKLFPVQFPNSPKHLSLDVTRWNREVEDEKEAEAKKKKTGIVAKFKQMTKDYWYVLIPVHVVTSVAWGGTFYLMCKTGVDVVSILQWCGLSEAYLEKLQHSEWQYYALAYACYKVATPVRYTVTVGGTTWSIHYLQKWGMLKTSADLASGIRERTDVAKDKLEDEWEKAWERYAKRRAKKKEDQ